MEKEILHELKEIKKLLQVFASNQEQKVVVDDNLKDSKSTPLIHEFVSLVHATPADSFRINMTPKYDDLKKLYIDTKNHQTTLINKNRTTHLLIDSVAIYGIREIDFTTINQKTTLSVTFSKVAVEKDNLYPYNDITTIEKLFC